MFPWGGDSLDFFALLAPGPRICRVVGASLSSCFRCIQEELLSNHRQSFSTNLLFRVKKEFLRFTLLRSSVEVFNLSVRSASKLPVFFPIVRACVLGLFLPLPLHPSFFSSSLGGLGRKSP